MVGGIDALIKVAQGWPISDAPLSLIKLKSPSNSMNEISLNFLCTVVVSCAGLLLLDIYVFQKQLQVNWQYLNCVAFAPGNPKYLEILVLIEPCFCYWT